MYVIEHTILAQLIAQSLGLDFLGNIIYLNPKGGGGHVGVDGKTPITAVTTLSDAFNLATAGQNDVIVLLSDGTTASSVRLSAGFTWNKNAVHMIGWDSGTNISNRSRIAPAFANGISGNSVTGFANFFTVSASGCLFKNLEFFQGFTVGVAAEICLTVTGSRNVFDNCHFAGMADTDAGGGADTGSRNIKISGGGQENLFKHCTIGDDTEARTVANASVELAGGTTRNQFEDCLFPFFATNSAVLGVLGTGNACVDRFNLFKRCTFVNSIKSGSGTAMTALLSFTTNAPGGLIAFMDSAVIGITKWGDTNGLANSYINVPAVSAAAGGLSLNPS